MTEDQILRSTIWNDNVADQFWQIIAKKKNRITRVKEKAAKMFYWGEQAPDNFANAISIIETGLSQFSGENEEAVFEMVLLAFKIKKKIGGAGRFSEELLRNLIDNYKQNPAIVELEVELFWTLIEMGNLEKAADQLRLLDKKISPNSQYYNALLASHLQFSRSTNNFSRSDKFWKAEYKRRRKVENTGILTFEELIEIEALRDLSFEAAAENMISEYSGQILGLNNYQFDGIGKLETAILKERVVYKNGKWESSRYDVWIEEYRNYNEALIPDLGSYLGNWTIKNYQGQWRLGERPLQSEIELIGGRFNPFHLAYDFAYYRHNLWLELQQVLKNLANGN